MIESKKAKVIDQLLQTPQCNREKQRQQVPTWKNQTPASAGKLQKHSMLADAHFFFGFFDFTGFASTPNSASKASRSSSPALLPFFFGAFLGSAFSASGRAAPAAPTSSAG